MSDEVRIRPRPGGAVGLPSDLEPDGKGFFDGPFSFIFTAPLLALTLIAMFPYLANPLVARFGTAATAYYVSAKTYPSSARRDVGHSVTFRYEDIDGESRQFGVGVTATEANAFAAKRSVPMHYVSGWPSTAGLDEYDAAASEIMWIVAVVMLAVYFYKLRRMLRG
jgi:hypothetical protein